MEQQTLAASPLLSSSSSSSLTYLTSQPKMHSVTYVTGCLDALPCIDSNYVAIYNSLIQEADLCSDSSSSTTLSSEDLDSEEHSRVIVSMGRALSCEGIAKTQVYGVPRV
jgi:hypothetical protein